MSDFNIGIRSNHQRKYRYPSYLMRVAPPPSYSSVDLKNMLVGKTHALKKASYTSVDYIRSNFLCAKYSESKSDVSKVTLTSKATDVSRKHCVDELLRGIHHMSLNENLDETESEKITESNFSCGKNKRVVEKNDSVRKMAKNSFKVSNVEIVDEVKRKNHQIVPTCSNDNIAFENNLSSHKMMTTNQTEKGEIGNDDYRHYSNQKQMHSMNVSLRSPSNFDDIKLIKMCTKCHKSWPLDNFDISEVDKTKLIKIIEQTTSENVINEKVDCRRNFTNLTTTKSTDLLIV